MRVGSEREAGRALVTVLYGYAAMPIALGAMVAIGPFGGTGRGTGMFPEPVLWLVSLMGTAVSWGMVRSPVAGPAKPQTLFHRLLIAYVCAEFPVLLAFLNVLSGGPATAYVGIAAVSVLYFLTVALPAAKNLARP